MLVTLFLAGGNCSNIKDATKDVEKNECISSNCPGKTQEVHQPINTEPPTAVPVDQDTNPDSPRDPPLQVMDRDDARQRRPDNPFRDVPDPLRKRNDTFWDISSP
ncbi:MAG: hypothetical protein H6907_20260 [Hyphomicrobiales bacterium]|nr:hypothetical protein [Hyphomicrobiales bacterium]MCP5374075.1 hypothetical protein [Hyphomicrobiales bacterium]